MKQKLLALVFLIALAITPFLALSANSAEAAARFTTPGTCVDIRDEAVDGAITAFTNITAHTDAPPLEFNFVAGC